MAEENKVVEAGVVVEDKAAENVTAQAAQAAEGEAAENGKGKKKKKKARLSDKHPVLGLILTTYGSFLVAQIVFMGLLYYPLTEWFHLERGTLASVASIIGSFVVLLFWYKRWSPEFHAKPGKGSFVKALQLSAMIVVYWVLVFGCFGVVAKGFPFAALNFSSIVMALMAGISEEILFREITVSYMTKRWNTEKMIPWLAAISAVMFGVTHITNAVTGMGLGNALFQACLTFLIGYFFTAVYLRTGNVWGVVIIHAVHDLLAFSSNNALNAVGVTAFPIWVTVLIVVVEAGLAVYGFYLLRKEKRSDIIALWKERWSQVDAPEASEASEAQ